MRPLPLLAAVIAMAAVPASRAAEAPKDTTIDCNGLAESVSTDAETSTEFHDNVVAVGNDLVLHCDYLKVIATRIGEKAATLGKYGKFKYMLATGHVKIVQGDRVATCGRAEVFPNEDRVVLTEQPVVSIPSEGYTATAPRMVLYRGQRRAVLEGTPGQPSHISLPPIKDLGFPAQKAGDKPSN
jgi:lipopolysaccharide export system protein LptA